MSLRPVPAVYFMPRRAAVAVIWLSLAAVAGAQSLETFLAQFRRATHADDRAAVAGMIQFPITIAIAGLRVPFKDAPALLERYDDIFTPALLDSIARDTGDITIETVNGEARITAISVPNVPAGTTAPAATPGAVSRGIARDGGPRRVSIRVGPRPTHIPGVLARGATDVLIVYLPKARLASIRLERVPAGSATIRVVHAGTGTPLSARAGADGRFVSGRPAQNGEYRIEVQRMDNTDERHLPYMLSLSLR